jgi:hypothetical protein
MQYHQKTEFSMLKNNFSFGDKQAAFIQWKELGRGVCLVEASEHDRKEFGPGVFRVGAGEMHYELIVRIDPRTMQLFFVNNEVYENDCIIEWEPVKLTKLIISNQPVFESAFKSI